MRYQISNTERTQNKETVSVKRFHGQID